MSSKAGAKAPADESIVVPPLVADPILIDAVDEAVLGDALRDHGEAQPDRPLAPQDFASFYLRHRSSLEMHARRFLSDAHDIEDVVQETYLKLFLAIPELETELQALGFARRVMTNLCIDRYRASRRRPSVINLDTGYVEELSEDEPSDPVIQAEDAAVVRQALALLSPLHRAALVKREVEEKSLSVIAEELGIPETSVKHLLFRARRALRRLLVGSAVDPETPMTTIQILGAANQRVGTRAVQTGQYVVVLLVLLAVGVIITRGGSGVHRSGTLDAEGQAVLPSATQPLAPGPSGDATSPGGIGGPNSAGGAPNSGPTSQTATSPAVTSTQRSGAPQSTPTTTRPSSGGSSDAPSSPTSPSPGESSPSTPIGQQAALRLTGNLPTVGEPSIVNQQQITSASKPALYSQFVAPTAMGDFALKQIVTAGSQAPATFTVQLPVAGQSIPTTAQSYSSGASALPDGNTLVSGVLSVVPFGQNFSSATSEDITQVQVSLVMTPDATSIVSETVNVSAPAALTAGLTPSPAGVPSETDASPTPSQSD